MPAVAIAGAITAGSAAVTYAGQKKAASQAADAAQHAADAQNAALGNVKPIDVASTAAAAKTQDLQKYQDQFAALNNVDPVTGQIRSATNDALLNSVLGDPNTTSSNAILKSLFDENVNINPADAAFQSKLKSLAQQNLDMGGAFSPDQQAEFVRAGLEGSSASGFGPGSSAAKQSVGKLLASESNALELQRQQQAQNLFGFANDLSTSRTNTLLNINAGTLNAAQAQQQKLLNLAQLADNRTPSIGLSGSDLANLNVGNANLANQTTLQAGGVQSNLAVNQGNAAVANTNAQTGLITGLLGAAGGVATGYLNQKPIAASTVPASVAKKTSTTPTFASTLFTPKY